MDGWMVGWLVGLMVRWFDGLMVGSTDASSLVSLYVFVSVCISLPIM